MVHVSHCLHPGAGFSPQVNGTALDWRTPLFNACISGSQDCVNSLLMHGAAPHPESNLASPIHEAAKRGKFMGNFWVFTQSYRNGEDEGRFGAVAFKRPLVGGASVWRHCEGRLLGPI